MISTCTFSLVLLKVPIISALFVLVLFVGWQESVVKWRRYHRKRLFVFNKSRAHFAVQRVFWNQFNNHHDLNKSGIQNSYRWFHLQSEKHGISTHICRECRSYSYTFRMGPKEITIASKERTCNVSTISKATRAAV